MVVSSAPTATDHADAATQFQSRFWSQVDQSAGSTACWNWIGKRNRRTGEGRVTFGCRAQSAHRVAYLLSRGTIPDGLLVLHTCRNRSCCNPAHLELGTAADLMARRYGAGGRRVPG